MSPFRLMQLHSLGVERSQARINAEWTKGMKEMRQYDLKGRALQWLLPDKKKHCHSCCLLCRWYRLCRQEVSSWKGAYMKQGKVPTLAQKKYLRSRGMAPAEWYIVKDTPELMEVVSRRELARCQIRKAEGGNAKPRTRILRKERQ
mgnify:CR=1 FL=1